MQKAVCVLGVGRDREDEGMFFSGGDAHLLYGGQTILERLSRRVLVIY